MNKPSPEAPEGCGVQYSRSGIHVVGVASSYDSRSSYYCNLGLGFGLEVFFRNPKLD